MATLDTALRSVVGKSAGQLERELGLRTVGQLLRHYPRRYVARGELTGFGELVEGEHATIFAQVVKVSGRQIREKLHKTDVVVTDGVSTMSLALFNRKRALSQLRPGRRAVFAGKVETFRKTTQLANPEYEVVEDDHGTAAEDFAGALVAIYPTTAKLRMTTITRCVSLALHALDPPGDPLPADLRRRHRLIGLGDALRLVHKPQTRAEVARAHTRLKWDEALLLQVTLAQRRAQALASPATPRVARPGGLLDAFDAAIPFSLTDGQSAVGEVLTAELARPHPMHRLLQGEVGSGKTVVALRAMLAVVDAGGQAALLAPTEVLAGQHARSLRELLGPLGGAGELGGGDTATRVALLTGSASAGVRRSALAEIADGTAGIVVGTHALLEPAVRFADLGLVVVDEQHRFGVEQREALRAKGGRGGTPPHVLVMTATPIPRTVAMTVYGDLETSTLRELPAGRSPLSTSVVPVADKPGWLDRVWQRVREEVAGGHQAFVVCARIGPGVNGGTGEERGGEEELGTEDGRRPAAAVADVLPLLAAGQLAGLRLAALHGQLPAEQKDAVMRRFAAGSLDVLVATTVIEVGVDVPGATVMVVLDADRFGVSQLHQLRGRIGRGSAPGLCLLVTDALAGSPARQRVEAVAATSDGFKLARLDLEQRREGDVLGASQSGRRSGLRLLQLLRDEDLIGLARDEATALVAADPGLAAHPELAAALAAELAADRAEWLERG